jgi:hypothetical protein
MPMIMLMNVLTKSKTPTLRPDQVRWLRYVLSLRVAIAGGTAGKIVPLSGMEGFGRTITTGREPYEGKPHVRF